MLEYLIFPKTLSLIYGPPGSGKSTLCMQITANIPGKTIFIDTENSINIEKIQQINPLINLENIIIIKAKRYSEQTKAITNLKAIKNSSLIIIDSFTVHYRKKTTLQKRLFINKSFTKMLVELQQLNAPIIITSQIYTDFKKQNHPLAENILRKFCTQIIELKNNTKRTLTIENTKTIIPYTITNTGLTVEYLNFLPQEKNK